MRIGFALIALAVAGCQNEPAADERDRDGIDGGLGRIEGERKADKAAPATPAPVPAPPPAPASATAQPAPGTPQRAAIMDALRPAIERQLGGPIEFVVQRAAVQEGWALVIAEPQRPGGGAVSTAALPPEEERDGVTVNAILRFSGGAWTLVDHAIGPTDVWYCGIDGPPAALLGC